MGRHVQLPSELWDEIISHLTWTPLTAEDSHIGTSGVLTKVSTALRSFHALAVHQLCQLRLVSQLLSRSATRALLSHHQLSLNPLNDLCTDHVRAILALLSSKHPRSSFYSNIRHLRISLKHEGTSSSPTIPNFLLADPPFPKDKAIPRAWELVRALPGILANLKRLRSVEIVVPGWQGKSAPPARARVHMGMLGQVEEGVVAWLRGVQEGLDEVVLEMPAWGMLAKMVGAMDSKALGRLRGVHLALTDDHSNGGGALTEEYETTDESGVVKRRPLSRENDAEHVASVLSALRKCTSLARFGLTVYGDAERTPALRDDWDLNPPALEVLTLSNLYLSASTLCGLLNVPAPSSESATTTSSSLRLLILDDIKLTTSTWSALLTPLTPLASTLIFFGSWANTYPAIGNVEPAFWDRAAKEDYRANNGLLRRAIANAERAGVLEEVVQHMRLMVVEGIEEEEEQDEVQLPPATVPPVPGWVQWDGGPSY